MTKKLKVTIEMYATLIPPNCKNMHNLAYLFRNKFHSLRFAFNLIRTAVCTNNIDLIQTLPPPYCHTDTFYSFIVDFYGNIYGSNESKRLL